MPVIESVLFCDGCGAEISGAPFLRGKLFHCCRDCADGMECDCALILADEGGAQEGLMGPPFGSSQAAPA